MKTRSFVLDVQSPEVPEEIAGMNTENTLVLAFAPPTLDGREPVWAHLRSVFPDAQLIGCSTAGEIENDMIYDEGIVVAVAQFDSTKVRLVHADIEDASESFDAGARLLDELAGDDLQAVFVLSEGLNVNGTRLIEGMNSRAAPDVAITGGLAGDGDRFEKTWIIVGGERREKTIAAVGLYGEELMVGHGCQGGWDGFGMRRTVTRSEGNVLFELSGRPALEVYKEYLGDLADGLPANALLFPLSMHGANDEEHVVRTVLSIDEEAQSMTFAGDIPEGMEVQLMRANFDRLIEGASEAGRLTTARAAAEGGESLSIAVSCVGRRLVLGARAEEEVESALETLPEGTTLVGFYSYGELSPHVSGPCQLHNQTMTLTTFIEKKAA